MTKYIFLLIFIAFLEGCTDQIKDYNTTSLSVDSTEIKYRKGDCISFKINPNKIGAAIVIDYSKDEGGLWYGLCFTDYLDTVQPDLPKIKNHRLVGRKIESSLDKNGYIIGLDAEFVNESCFRKQSDKFKFIGKLNLRIDRIIIGADGATNNFDQMIAAFLKSMERRKSPSDDYRDHVKKLDKFRPDEYFDIKGYIFE